MLRYRFADGTDTLNFQTAQAVKLCIRLESGMSQVESR